MRQAAYASEFALAGPPRPMISPRRALRCHSEESRQSALLAPQGGTTRKLLFPTLAKSRSLGRLCDLGMTAIVVCLLALAAPAPARATIRYEISLAHTAQHQFHIAMTIPGVHGSVALQMPAWNALYQIRDFAYRVSEFRATDALRNVLPVRRLDKDTWRVEVPAGSQSEIRIEYASFWDDPGPFGTQLSEEHAFLNLAMVLCYLPERRGEDTLVRFSDIPPGWRVGVELREAAAESGGAACKAANYEALVDAPVEIGRFDEWSFQGGGAAAGKTIRVVYHGDALDRGALTRMLSQIVNYETRLMG